MIAALLLAFQSVSAQVVISEFLASNDQGAEDDFGNAEDWIELHNPSDSAVDLDGWSLTDDKAKPRKWVFPAGAVIGPNERMIVWASKRARAVTGSPYHTNFSLKRSGEYLALVEPDGVTRASEWDDYPVQATDVSYGISRRIDVESAVTLGTSGRYGVPRSSSEFASQFDGWNTSLNGAFTGSRWSGGALGVGYEIDSAGGPYGPLIGAGSDVRNAMRGINESIFVRVPFQVDRVGEVTAATLDMRWDDGFVAYLNGVAIAADRAPTSLGWNAGATSTRSDALNDETVRFSIDLTAAPLNEGSNLLAIHGLNRSVGSSDFLLQPELVLTRETDAGLEVYFNEPTPGLANDAGTDVLGPIFGDVTEAAIEQPSGGSGSQPLIVQAQIAPGTHPVQSVNVSYCKMFEAETVQVLRDDGAGADQMANDGIYSGSIPTTQLVAGEMLRWRFVATDSRGVVRTMPEYPDPLDSDSYYGTVARDADLASSQLPVLQTFVSDEAAVDTRGGGRVAVYYLGEFYDNVQMDLHGQSSAGFPKKSYDLDFNRGSRFRWRDGERRVKDINLLTNWSDKSKVRNTLVYGLLNDAGNPTHFAFPVRVERNGEFFSIATVVEDGDDRYLDRVGLDGDGALYKVYDALEDPAASSKKTRKDEGSADLATLITMLDDTRSDVDLRRDAYDHIDLPTSVNMLASYFTFGIGDFGHKNYYVYRDTEGSGEWRLLPWDIDLSMGRRWRPQLRSFHDDFTNEPQGWDAGNDFLRLIYDTPEFRTMLVRRMETLRRKYLIPQSDGLTEIERRLPPLLDLMDPPGVPVSDADLDYLNWFNPGDPNPSWGNRNTMRAEAARIVNEWLPAYRNHVFANGYAWRGSVLPGPQASLPDVDIASVDANPASGVLDHEYIQLRNRTAEAVDMSGWTLSGAVDFTFPAGTVLLSGNGRSTEDYRGALFVARKSEGFRSRSTRPTGGEYRFVVGGYDGQLSARGETLVLRNAAGQLVDEFTYFANPTAAQQSLRITEINYHPVDPRPTELAMEPSLIALDFEYLELTNITSTALDLGGVHFSEGVDYTFSSGVTLAAGERIVLAKNPEAFALRYGAGARRVFGPFAGQLDNGGEGLKLRDGSGENVLDIDYEDHWYPSSDGQGSSLVLRDEAIAYDQYDRVSSWGASAEVDGSPGAVGNGWLHHFNAWAEENFTAQERVAGGPGDPASDTDGDGLSTWMEYALGYDPTVVNELVFDMEIIEANGERYMGMSTVRRIGTSDVEVVLMASPSVGDFSPVVGQIQSNEQTDGPGRELVTVRDTAAIGSTDQQFYVLKIRPR